MFYNQLILEDKLREFQNAILIQKIQLDEIVSKLSTVIYPFEEITRKVTEQMTKVEITVNTFVTLMLSLGWPPLLDVDPQLMEIIIKAYNENKEDNLIQDVNTFLLEFYDEKILFDKLSDWKNKDWLKNRIPILEAVIEAHLNGNYWLSVPGILPQIEGVIAYGFKYVGYRFDKKREKYFDLLFKERFSLSEIHKAIKNFMNKIIFIDFGHGSAPKSFLSRHAILHGGDTTYGTAENSLKVILLFDYLQKSFGLVSLEKGSTYHLIGCPIIYKRKKETNLKMYRTHTEAELDNKKPCRKCKPLQKNPW
jgi:hypothetical protein